MKRLTFAFLICSLNACSSFQFDKKTMIWSMVGGVAAGALAGAAIKEKDNGMNREQMMGMGAAVGAAVGAGAVTAFATEDKVIDTTFIDNLLKDRNSKRKGGRTYIGETKVLPSSLPNEVQKMLQAPRIRVGKTGWEEIDGSWHEPHRTFEYLEGGLGE
ncbi:MAG: hypothetical protein R3C42_10000 [Parvularculaceae bacterium]